MRGNKLAKCYQCYYAFWVEPLKDGKARISTCYKNIFRPENYVIAEHNIKDAWNSRQFQFQRALASKGDWSFCQGASCLTRDYIDFLDKDSIIKEYASKGVRKLDSFAKLLIISPSFTCNNMCYFCFQAKERKQGLNYELKDNIIEEIKRDIVPLVDWVVVSGGEPFFAGKNKDFIEWVIKNYPEKNIQIITNGTLIREFGIKKIIDNKIKIRVTLYGMNKQTYKNVTGRDSFDLVFSAVNELLKLNYNNLSLVFLVSSKTIMDLGEFCSFVENNRNLKAIIQNDIFEGKKFWGEMKKLESEYSGLSQRLIFDYRNEAFFKKALRRMLNILYSLKYSLLNNKIL